MSTPEAAPQGGNVYDKYGTRHPIERRLVAGFLAQVDELAERTGAREAHEVGCGEGELTMLLARRGLRMRGSDVDAEVVTEARRRAAAAGLEIDYRQAPLETLSPPSRRGGAGRLLRGARARQRSRPRPRGAHGPRQPLADRQRPARTAVAGAQPRPRPLRGRARQHAGASRPLVAAGVRALALRRADRGRGSHAPALDDGPLPRREGPRARSTRGGSRSAPARPDRACRACASRSSDGSRPSSPRDGGSRRSPCSCAPRRPASRPPARAG